jgi:isocitrate dehydrogenase
MTTPKIVWTEIDEAPALATYSLLPIVKGFTKGSGFDIELWDISLAGRIIATFPEYLTESQRIPDNLAAMGELTLKPEANIIKLPNISASVPQIKACVKELQEQGYKLPDYPEEPKTDAEKEIKERYTKCQGSAVNPVLRQGNSDRRSSPAVKRFAQANPNDPLPLLPWSKNSKTRVSHMTGGDFYGSEKSVTLEEATNGKIEFVADDGKTTTLTENLGFLNGEVIDSSVMNVRALRKFFEEQIEATEDDVLLSLHLKATMMKVSDPPMFGHAVSVYYKDVFEKHAAVFKELGVNPDLGMNDLYLKIKALPADKKAEIEADIQAVYDKRPKLAMVDSSKGITNLHASNDIIIDASMPVIVRDGGQMWGPDNKLHDTNAMIPDRCYSTFYKEIIEDCKKNGAFNRSTVGCVPNVGLMAQGAEEYGSHPTTFLAPGNGKIRVVDGSGKTLLEQNVEKGDIYRTARAKDAPIKDWIKLAVTRARATGAPAVFWLDKNRGHDVQIIKKIEKYLPEHDTKGLEFLTMAPQDAMKYTLKRFRAGKDTISVTGNAIRDYLTDLFPITELGTSAKMLSIVPMLNGGGLFETGAGGSAPKHVQQFLKEGHLRWDSIGEFCALVESLKHLGNMFKNEKALLFSETLDQAIDKFLQSRKNPSRKVKEIDNRGSHYYLAMCWAQALAAQTKDKNLQAKFADVAKQLEKNEAKINEELLAAQGAPVDIGGYYHPDKEKTTKAMRPSPTLNKIVDAI